MGANVLSGVKVVELSTFVAAPGCARVMADWGADVIKVEPLTGDIWRVLGPTLGMPALELENPNFDVDNANKRAISVDMKTSEGMEVVHKLLWECDVLITNYRIDALKKLGLDYETVCEKYPGLVYGHVVGFGEKGPDKDRPGFDITAYLARTGVMGEMGEPDSPPLNIISSFGDHQAAMNLAAGVCGALYRKNTTGQGDKVTVSLYHTAIYALSTMLAGAQYGRVNYPISRTKPLNPMVNTYKCQDGRWLVLVCPDFERQWPILCNAIGEEELGKNEKYLGVKNMMTHKTEIVEKLDDVFAQKSFEDWTARLTKADLPHEKIQKWKEVIEDEQAWANDYFYKMSYENGKTATLATTPVQFESLGTPAYEIAPKLGEHTKEIMMSLGYSENKINEMSESKIINVR